MQVTCYHCNGTGTSPINQETCHVCGGSGLTSAISTIVKIRARTESNFDLLVDLTARIEDCVQKLDDIMEKCNEIKAVVDAL